MGWQGCPSRGDGGMLSHAVMKLGGPIVVGGGPVILVGPARSALLGSIQAGCGLFMAFRTPKLQPAVGTTSSASSAGGVGDSRYLVYLLLVSDRRDAWKGRAYSTSSVFLENFRDDLIYYHIIDAHRGIIHHRIIMTCPFHVRKSCSNRLIH